MGTQFQAVVLPLAAVEGRTVQKALEIDDSGIPLLGCPIHGHQAGIAVGHLLDPLVHVGGGYLDLFLLGGEALVLAQGDLRIHGDHGLKGKTVLGGLAHHLHAGIPHRLEFLLLHRRLIGVGERNIDSLLEEDLLAVHTLDDLPGGLAGAETGYVNPFAHLQIRLFDSGLKFLRAHLNCQGYQAFLHFFTAFHTHVVYSSVHPRFPRVPIDGLKPGEIPGGAGRSKPGPDLRQRSCGKAPQGAAKDGPILGVLPFFKQVLFILSEKT